MAGTLNRAQLLGNVGRDPEIKSFQNGGKVAKFSIATSEKWKDKNTGESREKTEWHNISVYNEALVGIVERFVKKGSKLYIEGAIETRKWQDQSGGDRYSTEIALRPYNGMIQLCGDRQGGQQHEPKPDFDDSIPF